MSAQQPTSSAHIDAYSGGSVVARAGQYIRVIDLEGVQIGDLFAVVTDNHDEFLSPSVTRLHNRTLFPRVGQSFFSNDDRPILTFVRDDSPGIHDMMFGSCNANWFAQRGMENHPNCRDNYFIAAGAAGINHVTQPDPVNIFQNTPPAPDGTFFIGVTMSNPGDSVTLRADIDCIVVLTACSSERVLGGQSTPMRLEVYDNDPNN
jgi:uncharacterized protein YcgI (DUF1989 family)